MFQVHTKAAEHIGYKHNQLIGEENQSCQVTYIHVDKTCGLREVSPFVSYSRDLGLMEISLNA